MAHRVSRKGSVSPGESKCRNRGEHTTLAWGQGKERSGRATKEAMRAEPVGVLWLQGVYCWWMWLEALPGVYEEIVGQDPEEDATSAESSRLRWMALDDHGGPAARYACRESR